MAFQQVPQLLVPARVQRRSLQQTHQHAPGRDRQGTRVAFEACFAIDGAVVLLSRLEVGFIDVSVNGRIHVVFPLGSRLRARTLRGARYPFLSRSPAPGWV